MQALSAFPRSYLEEIISIVLILSNLAIVSGYPLRKKKNSTKHILCSLWVKMNDPFKSSSVL